MGVNLDKPHRWKTDTQQSVDYYNEWFLDFAPSAYRETRHETSAYVIDILGRTNNLKSISVDLLISHPDALEMLRMSTAPPLARDRLVGLAKVTKSLVENMEKRHRVSPRMAEVQLREELTRIINIIRQLIDYDIFTWLASNRSPLVDEISRASTVVADRLCGILADPLIRNAQETRQLDRLSQWLESHGYVVSETRAIQMIQPGTYAHRVNVTAFQDSEGAINIPIDTVIQPKKPSKSEFPLLVEAKSAGDFTNTNKRRKEEATKIRQLRNAFGESIHFILLLGGYFDSGYLGYEAAEGIDWVWEHRMDDLIEFGL